MARKSKHLASVSLAAMGAGFISTLFFSPSTSVALLQGGFEGGLVGGLADWFAVTALFRHPLGIPIPHTALVVKNRNRITEQLVSLLENDWLSKQSILNKLKKLDLTAIVLNRLIEEIHNDRTGKAIVAVSRALLQAIDLHRIAGMIAKEVQEFLLHLDLKKLLQRIINSCFENAYEEKSLDFIIHKALKFVQQPESRQKLGTAAIQALSNIELEGFLQFALKSFLNLINEDKLGAILQNLLVSNLENLSKPDNTNRAALLAFVREEIKGLETNTKLLAEIQAWRTSLIESWDLHATIYGMLEHFQQKSLQFIETKEYLQLYILPFIQNGLTAARDNPAFMEAMEQWMHQQINTFVDENHTKIGTMILENLNKLDNETLIEMMEDKVGQDLQWIRVNGAVCGFLIGGIITGIKLLTHV